MAIFNSYVSLPEGISQDQKLYCAQLLVLGWFFSLAESKHLNLYLVFHN